MQLPHTFYLALSEVNKQAFIYRDVKVMGIVCQMLEADTMNKLKQAFNAGYNDVKHLVDTLTLQELGDAIDAIKQNT